MDQVDRYVLGLAVLEGDRDARKILADLLEEQGDRGLAAWARKCKGKTSRHLDLVLMLLPARTSVKLGSEFLSASVADVQGNELLAAQQLTAIVRRWYLGEIDDTNVVSVCRAEISRIQSDRRQTFPIRYSESDSLSLRRMEAHRLALILGLQNVVSATAASDSNPRLIRHFEQQASHKVREIAKGTQTWIVPETSNLGDRCSGLQWQISRTKAVLNHLISPKEYPWPK